MNRLQSTIVISLLVLASACHSVPQRPMNDRPPAPLLEENFTTSLEAGISELAFSPDGRAFVVVLGDRSRRNAPSKVQVYDQASGEKLATVTNSDLEARGSGEQFILRSAGVSMDRNEFYFAGTRMDTRPPVGSTRTLSSTDFVEVWSIEPTRPLESYDLREVGGGGHWARVVANKDYIVFNGQPIERGTGNYFGPPYAETISPTEASLSEDNLYMVGSGLGGIVYLWDLANDSLTELSTGNWLTATTFAGNHQFLVSANENGRCKVWHIPDSQVAHHCGRRLPFLDGTIGALAAHPKRDLFALSRGNWVSLYKLDPFEELVQIETSAPVEHLGFSGNDRLAMADDYGEITVWDLNTRRMAGRYETEGVTQFAVHPENGQVLVVSGRTLQLLDTAPQP